MALKIAAPTATPPIKAASPSRPMTAASTKPISGVEALASMIGVASASTPHRVGMGDGVGAAARVVSVTVSCIRGSYHGRAAAS